MEIKIRARKWGNSIGFVIPRDIADAKKIKENEDVELTVSDSYGETYKFKAKIRRVIKRTVKATSILGTEFIDPEGDFARAVKFTYGDSQRWVDVWADMGKGVDTKKLIWALMVQGIYAEKEIAQTIIRWMWGIVNTRIRRLLNIPPQVRVEGTGIAVREGGA